MVVPMVSTFQPGRRLFSDGYRIVDVTQRQPQVCNVELRQIPGVAQLRVGRCQTQQRIGLEPMALFQPESPTSAVPYGALQYWRMAGE
ncbi:MAG: hypothetical protein C0505_18575 [Leptothrix sp. (in: Bacteria)]|nr:hypothetical protein [Leptothrix sp. (in: b-proteobacteria)]